MLRLILSLIMVFSSLFVGQSMSSRLHQRKETLSLFHKELSAAVSRIAYASPTVYELFVGFSFDRDSDFLSQWNKLVRSYRSLLKKEDIAILSDFAKELGGSDAASQINHIKLYITLLEENLREAQREIEKKSKLYKLLGFCAGTSLALLLI